MPLSIHSLLFEKRPNFYVPISFKLLILVSSRRYDAKKIYTKVTPLTSYNLSVNMQGWNVWHQKLIKEAHM